MKYDTIIIGGGMSGLVAGIRLRKAGQKVAIVSVGQSALHFNSGSMSLLGHEHGRDVVRPLESIEHLSAEHPYGKLGMENIRKYVSEVAPLFAEAGVTLHGSAERNHYRLTPIGMFKPAWLSMDGYATVDDPKSIPWGKVLIVNLAGFIDFYPQFLELGLSKAGLECVSRTFILPGLETLRKSATEMRATNIARVLKDEVILQMASQINTYLKESSADTVLLPAILGLYDEEPIRLLRSKVVKPVYLVSTMPMSVGGMRAQMSLRKYFLKLGGTYLIGDKVTAGRFENDRLVAVSTQNLGDMPLEADNFILATGSFFSHGIEANPTSIYEPIFGLDVVASASRPDWCDMDIYKTQNYMQYGVVNDGDFHVYKDGNKISNLRAVGAVLAGCNSMKEESGGGVSLLTSIKVADDILNGKGGKK
ncbi:MAG: anaerobic glycerol-3-phosphate dehydrogenase subunit GlpB [Muribaculum sp.]|nr:anaerobic glycerol-3-phosphate dehydrogenase subunit GlpB [Muribaculum sp.]